MKCRTMRSISIPYLPSIVRRNGVSLIELLAVIFVIGLLASLILPAVQSSREASRRIQCVNNLKQLSLACGNYTSDYQCYPAGQLSAFVAILPQLDQSTLFNRFSGVDDPFVVNGGLNDSRPPVLACPDDWVGVRHKWATNYNWNRGWDQLVTHADEKEIGTGVILPPGVRIVREADVTDGLTNTALLAESLPVLSGLAGRTVWKDGDEKLNRHVAVLESRCRNATLADPRVARSAPWTSGYYGMTTYDHVVNPGGKTCLFVHTAASAHPANGVHVAACDGSVRFISASIDLSIWHAIGTRSGNETVSEW